MSLPLLWSGMFLCGGQGGATSRAMSRFSKTAFYKIYWRAFDAIAKFALTIKIYFM